MFVVCKMSVCSLCVRCQCVCYVIDVGVFVVCKMSVCLLYVGCQCVCYM